MYPAIVVEFGVVFFKSGPVSHSTVSPGICPICVRPGTARQCSRINDLRSVFVPTTQVPELNTNAPDPITNRAIDTNTLQCAAKSLYRQLAPAMLKHLYWLKWWCLIVSSHSGKLFPRLANAGEPPRKHTLLQTHRRISVPRPAVHDCHVDCSFGRNRNNPEASEGGGVAERGSAPNRGTGAKQHEPILLQPVP